MNGAFRVNGDTIELYFATTEEAEGLREAMQSGGIEICILVAKEDDLSVN